MIISSIDLKDKTLFHEIDPKNNYNAFSVMDYSTNKQGRSQKINNGITSTIDYHPINDNQVLLSYVPAILDRVVCKILTLEGTYITSGPMYTLDEDTNTNRISVTKLSNDKFAIFYNDNNKKLGKVIIVSIEKMKISTISTNIFYDGLIPQLGAINTNENEIAVFFQYGKYGMVRLIKFENNILKIIEEAIFYTGSDLWNLTIKQINDYHILGFINSDHKLCLKILQTTDKKISFTHGLAYTDKVHDDFFQMFGIDNEMVLCYFNNIVQVISLQNGQIIQPENIK